MAEKSDPKNNRPHSIRVHDEVWEAAKARAYSEGYKLNVVLIELLDGYGRGLFKLPSQLEAERRAAARNDQ